MLLKDKAGIVTGASHGIGRAIAVGLAAEGATVLVNYHKSEEAAENVVSEIRKAGGIALPFRADVSKKKEVEEMVAFALNRFGKIDFLINNAGLSTRTRVEDMTEEEWDLVLDTNLKGTFLCSQAVIQTMKHQKGGRIINIASGRGIGGQVKGTHYSASKAGMMGFTKSLSLELAPCGISVNAIAPGAMDTANWRRGKSNEEIETILDRENRAPNPLLRTVLVPEDIVGTVLFLLTDASKMITGQTVFLRTP
jgi:NAD(P)-dependent dehydrogenase (short-subunit alcohol dehydrogenase family)